MYSRRKSERARQLVPQRQRNPRELPYCINQQCMRIPRDSRSTSDKHLENGTALIHLSDALPDKKRTVLASPRNTRKTGLQTSGRVRLKNRWKKSLYLYKPHSRQPTVYQKVY